MPRSLATATAMLAAAVLASAANEQLEMQGTRATLHASACSFEFEEDSIGGDGVITLEFEGNGSEITALVLPPGAKEPYGYYEYDEQSDDENSNGTAEEHVALTDLHARLMTTAEPDDEDPGLSAIVVIDGGDVEDSGIFYLTLEGAPSVTVLGGMGGGANTVVQYAQSFTMSALQASRASDDVESGERFAGCEVRIDTGIPVMRRLLAHEADDGL